MASISIVYKPAPWSSLTVADAQVVGSELQRIEDRDGGVTPQVVVSEARPGDSLLHKYFEWDDSQAAELYREDQARNLTRSIIITTKEHETVRAFHSVMVTEGDRAYKSTESIKTNIFQSEFVVKEAQKELTSWAKRYEAYKEVFEVSAPSLSSIMEMVNKQ